MGCGCKKKTTVKPKVVSQTTNNGSNKTSVTVQTFKPKN